MGQAPAQSDLGQPPERRRGCSSASTRRGLSCLWPEGQLQGSLRKPGPASPAGPLDRWVGGAAARQTVAIRPHSTIAPPGWLLPAWISSSASASVSSDPSSAFCFPRRAPIWSGLDTGAGSLETGCGVSQPGCGGSQRQPLTGCSLTHGLQPLTGCSLAHGLQQRSRGTARRAAGRRKFLTAMGRTQIHLGSGRGGGGGELRLRLGSDYSSSLRGTAVGLMFRLMGPRPYSSSSAVPPGEPVGTTC